MVYTLSYQMYKYEHGLTAAGQRAADVRAGEAAAALRDLRLRLGRCACRESRPRLWPAGLLFGPSAVMIIAHVPAVCVSPDHAGRRVAAAVAA
jgi:hypothetical protein